MSFDAPSLKSALPLVIVGTGAQGRYVVDAVGASEFPQLLGLADAEAGGLVGEIIDGCPVVCCWREVPKRYSPEEVQLVIAHGDNSRKRDLARYLIRHGFSFATVVHPAAHIAISASVGPGSIVNPGALVLPGAVVAAHAIIHSGTVVEHDCRVEDFANLGPGVSLAGRAHIGTGAYVHTGASLIPDISVGDWSEVAAGAVVIRDVPEHTRVAGVPARPLEEHDSGA